MAVQGYNEWKATNKKRTDFVHRFFNAKKMSLEEFN